MPVVERLLDLRLEAEQISPLIEVPLTLPHSGVRYDIAQPADLDRLLDRAGHDPEQNLPYWSEIWPSGIALADAISQQPALLSGTQVLELGTGLGITATAALEAGARLTVADYAPESLLLCRYNTLRNTGREPETLQLNWRTAGDAVFSRGGASFPIVLAADVLYEARDAEPLLTLVTRLVAPNGLLWLAEPGRPVAERFLGAALSSGWHATTETHRGPWPDPKDTGVVVGLHQLRRL